MGETVLWSGETALLSGETEPLLKETVPLSRETVLLLVTRRTRVGGEGDKGGVQGG